ncbi:oligopeptide transport system permease protein oppC [Vibrio sp. JCM 19236]|nr:oligopeptide transport system permease protein oppC [Vibrio sp. JCM 19236]
MTPMMQMRIQRFKANRRGFWSLWIFLVLFIISLFAELVANDKPLFVNFDGGWYFPVAKQYSEMEFGGEFAAEADYTDPYVQELIEEKGYMIWPVIRFSYDTINYNLPGPAPSAPDNTNWLGTDDRGRDVLARIIYGFRISVLFGFVLTIISSIIGVIVGATQGYYGGKLDLIGQRFIEVWSGMLPCSF